SGICVLVTAPTLKCFYLRKIKTDVIDIYGHFVFMYLRSSSRELRDTPPWRNKIQTINSHYKAAFLFYTNAIISFTQSFVKRVGFCFMHINFGNEQEGI
ncbi:hypothetical protein AWW69_10030, partial [Bacillus cereus]